LDVHLAHSGACHLFVEMPRGQRMAAMPSSCPAIAARHCRVSCCPVAPLLLQSVRPSLLTPPSHSRSPPLALLLALVVTVRAERYVAAMAARSACATAVSAAPVLLRLLGPHPAYPTTKRTCCASPSSTARFRTLRSPSRYALTPWPSLPESLWSSCVPWPAVWAPPGVCTCPPAPPLAAGELHHPEPAIFPCSRLWKQRRTSGLN